MYWLLYFLLLILGWGWGGGEIGCLLDLIAPLFDTTACGYALMNVKYVQYAQYVHTVCTLCATYTMQYVWHVQYVPCTYYVVPNI